MIFKMLGRMAPSLLIIIMFMAVYWSPFFAQLPGSFQMFMVKIFLPVIGIMVGHCVGITLLPRVKNWHNDDQPYIKIARIVLYATLCYCISLGG